MLSNVFQIISSRTSSYFLRDSFSHEEEALISKSCTYEMACGHSRRPRKKNLEHNFAGFAPIEHFGEFEDRTLPHKPSCGAKVVLRRPESAPWKPPWSPKVTPRFSSGDCAGSPRPPLAVPGRTLGLPAPSEDASARAGCSEMHTLWERPENPLVAQVPDSAPPPPAPRTPK